MPFAPRLAALVLLVVVAACAPASRNVSNQTAKPASGGTPINQPAKTSPPAKPAATPPIKAQAPPAGQAASTLPAKAPASPFPGLPPQASAPAHPAAPAALDTATGSPMGFGGIAWGAPVSAQPGLAPYENSAESATVTCLWPQGPKDVFGAPIRDAYYEFFKDQFYHVWINFDGQAAYEKALAGLTRAFGPPTQENRDKFYHAWQLGDVNIYCAYHRDLNEGDVSFFYQPLYDRMIATRKAAEAKAPARSAKK
jgi:hypothetical protein